MPRGAKRAQQAELLGMLTAPEFAKKFGLTCRQVQDRVHTCRIKRTDGTNGYIRLDSANQRGVRLFYADAIILPPARPRSKTA